ncbi:MAG: restriction endonuclease subunit S [Hahellaceae bacterium]|nr:restriction endonuclease subunit S [Hahellaceae bacterium]MCP5209581.1 restriction endonuclease subunit S [Hahellaceae bacterium]
MEQVLYKLPDGWEWMQLGEALDVRDGTHDSPKYVESGFPLITSKNITGKGLDVQNVKYISQEDFDAINKRSKVDVGDILFAMIGTIGFPTVITDEPNYAIKNVALFKKRQDDQNMDFFKYFLESPYAIESMLAQAKGAAQKFVGLKVLRSFNVPLPPKVEQKRIVEKLDALLTRIDTAIEHLQESVKLADTLYASVLNELSTGIDGEKIKLGKLGKIIRGSSPRPKGDPRYYGGSIPRLMVADVTRDGRYVTPAIDFLTEEGALKSRPVPKGTLTIQVSGNPGMPAILAVDACIHDGFAALVEINRESISAEYLYFSLLAVAEQNNQMAVGAIFRNLTTSQLREIEVIIPSYEKQLDVVSKMDMAEQKVKALKAELKTQLDSIRQLKASILDSAFKGEL